MRKFKLNLNVVDWTINQIALTVLIGGIGGGILLGLLL